MLRALLLLLLCIAFPATIKSAWADTDYGCLNKCVNNSGKREECMKQCSFGDPNGLSSPPKMVPAKKPMTHKELSTLTPANEVLLMPKTKNPVLQKDYSCINACVKGGMQYQLCEARCTTLPDEQKSR